MAAALALCTALAFSIWLQLCESGFSYSNSALFNNFWDELSQGRPLLVFALRFQ
jgi:hypothetical protein